MGYDFLNSDKISTDKSFQPPEPEFRLKQHSSKLPVSSRVFPEWAVACYGVLKEKYPQLKISSMSELIALTMQDYIMDNYKLVDEQLPPTEDALDFLITAGYINPDNKRQFQSLSKANQKVNEYEAEAMSTDSLKKRYEYLKNRDPEKAEEVMEKMQEEFLAGLEQDESQEEEQETKAQDSPEEAVVSDNRSGIEKQQEQQEEIATLDYLDQVRTEDED